MSSFKKYISAAAIITGCFFIYSCENDQKAIDVWTKTKELKEEAINVESYFSQDGKVKAKLTAPSMLRVTANQIYVEFPNTLHVDFYSDSAQVQTILDSKYGKYFEGEEKVYLRDSVVVITVAGDTLKSPDLWWDQSKGMFYTDKYAVYSSKTQLIQGGEGLEATDDLKTVTFKKPTGLVEVKEDSLP